MSAAQIALAYLIGKPAVTSVIVGARTEAAAHRQPGLGELTLSDEEVSRLDAVSAEPLRYPLLASGREQPLIGSARPISVCLGPTSVDG